MAYNDKLSDYGDLIEIAEWLESCENSCFIDYDGFGYPVRDNFDGFPMMDRSLQIYPSTRHLLPKDATHIMWFNK